MELTICDRCLKNHGKLIEVVAQLEDKTQPQQVIGCLCIDCITGLSKSIAAGREEFLAGVRPQKSPTRNDEPIMMNNNVRMT